MNSSLWLLKELKRRQAKRPQYSLRCFAKTLQISPATLSLVLSGKRSMSLRVAKQVAEKLGLTAEERIQFLQLAPKETLTEEAPLDLESFKAMSDWYYVAILSLSHIEGAKADPAWIASKLQISESTARGAFERLKRLGLIAVSGRTFRQTRKRLSISSSHSSAAIREFHRQNLEHAKDSIENVPKEERYLTSLTVATNEDGYANALVKIDTFLRDLNRTLSQGNAHNQVYTLSVQLFPRTRS